MKKCRCAWAAIVPALGIWIVPLLVLGAATAAQGQAVTEVGVQMLTRGPIHEAFAEASMTGATAGIVVSKTPYEAIMELPPDQRPEGNNVAWIPGYWSWDDDWNDFIWISGVWRDLPPGRQWVPGYWAPVEGGSQWISGFWGDVAQTEVTYLPPPPASLEVGPSSPAPRPDNLWTPGCWVWQQTSYTWQPGYWVVQQPNWVWSPAHYTWTPRGYIYVPGYWDYDIVHRGVMFAPVYYSQPVYTHPDYHYSPSIVINLSVILTNLFVEPRSHQYYYGDYYDHHYEERGFYPWYSKQVTQHGDDPLYAHYRSSQLRHDPDWDVHIDEQYRHRREHVDARPPRTLALQIERTNSRESDASTDVNIGRSFTEAAQSRTSPMHFTSVSMDERRQIETHGREVSHFRGERRRQETTSDAVGKPERGAAETAQPVRGRLPVSPIAAEPIESVEGANTPPSTPIAPEPQAVEEGRGHQGRSHEVEVNREIPTYQEKPEEVRPNAQSHSERAGTRQSSTDELPQRIESTPETIRPESTLHGEESRQGVQSPTPPTNEPLDALSETTAGLGSSVAHPPSSR